MNALKSVDSAGHLTLDGVMCRLRLELAGRETVIPVCNIQDLYDRLYREGLERLDAKISNELPGY